MRLNKMSKINCHNGAANEHNRKILISSQQKYHTSKMIEFKVLIFNENFC